MKPLAVVTGAGGAIGGAIAAALGEKGHELLLIGRRESGTAHLFSRHEGRHVYADLSVLSDVERAGLELSRLDAVAVAVHAAGRVAIGTVEETSVDELDELYRVNVRAPYRLTQALLPALRAATGQLVFVNSSVAARPSAHSGGPYASTKHALRALADSIRAEENEWGVRVLSVFPGRTAGPLQERLYDRESRRYDADRLLQPADVAAAVVAALSLPRTAEVTDIHVRPMLKPAR